MKAELTEIEGVKYLVVPPGTRIVMCVASHDAICPDDIPILSKKQQKSFENMNIYDIPIIFVDDTSDFKLFQFECPVCRMFLDATHKDKDDAEKS